VQFFTDEPNVARRLARALAPAPSERLSVAPWPGLDVERRVLVRDALATR